MSQNDKGKCLRDGQSWERRVQTAFSSYLNLPFERNDAVAMQNMDFRCSVEVDVKYRGTRFEKAKQYVGLEPSKALPLNLNKLERYARSPKGKFILFIVKFTPDRGTNGLYLISIPKVLRLFRNNRGRTHKYKTRFGSTEHARESFYVSTDECRKLPDFIMELVLNENPQ